METKELTAGELRERMRAARVRQYDLAREAGMPQSDLSAILSGRMYCGDERMRRIGAAIVKFGLDKEPAVRTVRFRLEES